MCVRVSRERCRLASSCLSVCYLYLADNTQRRSVGKMYRGDAEAGGATVF
jgi:hypothetical protein